MSAAHTIPVRTTNHYPITVGPNQVMTSPWIGRKSDSVDIAVTEPMDTCQAGSLTVCPRVVALKGQAGNTVRIPVRVCNMSAHSVEIPPRSTICALTEVKVVESWSPDPTLPEHDESQDHSKTLEELGIDIKYDNLTTDQKTRAQQLLGKWEHLFSKSLLEPTPT